jgi:hypothetical protein
MFISDFSTNHNMTQAESSSQALEKYLTAQISELGLDIPSDDIEYMARFVEEDGIEVDEKAEGLKGMINGVVGEVGELFFCADGLGLGSGCQKGDR